MTILCTLKSTNSKESIGCSFITLPSSHKPNNEWYSIVCKINDGLNNGWKEERIWKIELQTPSTSWMFKCDSCINIGLRPIKYEWMKEGRMNDDGSKEQRMKYILDTFHMKQ